MSLFPQLHKPSASPVDATSIADLRRTPFPLSPLLCRPTVHQAPAAEDLPALLQPLHAAASVTFERAEPVTPPPSSESSQRLSLHIEEDPRSSQCPGDLASPPLPPPSSLLASQRTSSADACQPETCSPRRASALWTALPGSARPLLPVIQDKCHGLRAVLSDPQSEGGSASHHRHVTRTVLPNLRHYALSRPFISSLSLPSCSLC